MKKSQLVITLVILTGIVFLVTFLMNYVGDSPVVSPTKNPTKTTPAAIPELTFPARQYPLPNQFAAVEELGSNGFHDFWFFNDNSVPVELMLEETSCKCTEVRAFLANDEFKGHMLTRDLVPSFLVIPTVSGFQAVSLALASLNDEKIQSIRESIEKGEGILLKKKAANNLVIPPRGNGWVRMNWKGTGQETPGPAIRTATFSTQFPGAPPIRLDVGLVLEVPFRVLQFQEQLGDLDPRQLPREVGIIVWSACRSELDLDVQHAVVRGSSSRDPVRIGTPVKAKPQEIEEIEARAQRRVRCAYRVPVTIIDQEEGKGTLMDLGSFHRLIQIRLKSEPTSDPVIVSLDGSVLGDVVLDGKGRIAFPEFFSKEGSRKGICNVSTGLENLKVELDRERTSKFLKVRMPSNPEKIGGRFHYTIEALIEPNQVHGRFPREDDPDYQDCAIYLKCTGSSTRNIRIAVDGNAKER